MVVLKMSPSSPLLTCLPPQSAVHPSPQCAVCDPWAQVPGNPAAPPAPCSCHGGDHKGPFGGVHVHVSAASSQRSERVLQPWSSLPVTALHLSSLLSRCHDAINSLHTVPERLSAREPWTRITQLSHCHDPHKMTWEDDFIYPQSGGDFLPNNV